MDQYYFKRLLVDWDTVTPQQAVPLGCLGLLVRWWPLYQPKKRKRGIVGNGEWKFSWEWFLMQKNLKVLIKLERDVWHSTIRVIDQLWWHMSVILAFQRLRQGDHKFRASCTMLQVPAQPGLSFVFASLQNIRFHYDISCTFFVDFFSSPFLLSLAPVNPHSLLTTCVSCVFTHSFSSKPLIPSRGLLYDFIACTHSQNHLNTHIC